MMQWRIVPTAAGIGYLLMLLILMLVAVNYSNNLIFTLCFLMTATMLLSVWLSIRNLWGFRATHVRVRPVHAGQDLAFEIALNEHSGQHHLYLTLSSQHKQRSKTTLQPFYHLRSGQPFEWVYQQPTQQRGLHNPQRLNVDTVWPLGLFKLSRPLIELPETLVYPQAKSAQSIPETTCGQAAHAHTEAEELAGLRAYQPGDNPRRINWRSLSKGQNLQVKEFDGAAGDPAIWLRWQDLHAIGYEARIRTLCHHILECQKRGQEFGLLLPGIELPPKRGGQHISTCLKQLALLPGER